MTHACVLINADVCTGSAILAGHAVVVENGLITGVPPLSQAPDGMEKVDLAGKLVAPGFIDAQVNGGGGVLFNDSPEPDALKVIAEAHERYGTLHWCPTVITSGFDTMERCLGAVKAAKEMNLGVLGAHLEGPYISQARPGVHDKRFIRPADDAELDRLLAHGHISLVTVAPESAERRQIRRLTDAGIRVFLGHTDASCADALAAFEAGACGVTHLYNAMSPLTGREPGVTGAAFVSGDVWAGVIADGFHADWVSIQIAKKLKKTRLFLVTDAMPPVGKPDVVYTVGGREASCHGGRCATADGTLAGSALDMASAVRNCVTRCGVALDEALRMASAYPAEMLGVADRLGYIKSGYAADLVFLDAELAVAGVMRGGEVRIF
ncbi:MAG: N-acetylglucosamine-6-phosphate deacetylase [Oscillospiraceae bacterium]|nr:N-acetylglucosamine-6-phosphate deacetylase [Oscillospiraceae bacterium]